jgi:ABC-type sugar transport system substrate-binding protein
MNKRLLMMFACMMMVLAPALAKDKDIDVVFIPKSSDQAFWTFMRQGVEKAIQEIGNVTLTWRGPAYNDDTDSQINSGSATDGVLGAQGCRCGSKKHACECPEKKFFFQ